MDSERRERQRPGPETGDPGGAAGDPAAEEGAPEAPELARRLEELRESRREAAALAGHLDARAFRWRPDPDAWSIGHCLEHLVATDRGYLEVLDDALRRARARGVTGPGPFRYGFFGRWMVSTMEPPPGLHLPAPKSFAPPPEPRPSARVLEDFRGVGEALARRIREAAGLDLARVKVRSPVVPILRFPLGIAFAVVTAHERRHLWQARRIAGAPGFPRRGGGPAT